MPDFGAVLRRERLGDRLQLAVVRDLLGLALEHDIERPCGKVAAPGGKDAGGILGQVARLALFRAGAEPNRVAVPDSDERRDVRPAAPANGREPERVSGDDLLEARCPWRRRRVGMAETM